MSRAAREWYRRRQDAGRLHQTHPSLGSCFFRLFSVSAILMGTLYHLWGELSRVGRSLWLPPGGIILLQCLRCRLASLAGDAPLPGWQGKTRKTGRSKPLPYAPIWVSICKNTQSPGFLPGIGRFLSFWFLNTEEPAAVLPGGLRTGSRFARWPLPPLPR